MRPRKQMELGFSLLELMIVIAIIAVLVSLALPAYQDYTIRAKVAEGLSVAAAAKLAVEETCQTNGAANLQTQTGYQFQASRYVQSVSFLGTCDIMVIAITTHNTGATVDPSIWLFRLSLLSGNPFFPGFVAPTQGWTCFGWPSAEHLPSTCRLRNISN